MVQKPKDSLVSGMKLVLVFQWIQNKSILGKLYIFYVEPYEFSNQKGFHVVPYNEVKNP